MAVHYSSIIPLVRAAMLSEKGTLPDGFELDACAELAREHQITNILYEGAILCGADVASDGMKKLFARSCKNLMVSEEQLYEIQVVCDLLEKNGIDHMPVKGTLLKKIYPKTDMREMSDADILIHPEDYPKIKVIMDELGYEEKLESDHDFTFVKGKITLEMHKYLVSPKHKAMFDYFEKVWEKALTTQGCSHRFELPPTDNYIYLFMHLSKHYIDGGIGIKHITDMFVMKGDKIDEGYVIEALERMKLADFYKNIVRLIDVWFYGKQSDDVIEFISEFIISGGAYGTYENHMLSLTAGGSSFKPVKHAKVKRYIRLIFPTLADMKYSYPVLLKAPVLLPFVWVYRWFAVLFGKRGDIGKAKQSVDAVSDEKISQYVKAMEYVGLGENAEKGKDA